LVPVGYASPCSHFIRPYACSGETIASSRFARIGDILQANFRHIRSECDIAPKFCRLKTAAEISRISTIDKLQISKHFFRKLRQPPENSDI
jgi:hypothetical protein